MIRHSCQQCGASFEAKSPAARFCSARCRKASSRGTPGVGASDLSPVTFPVTARDTVTQVQAELVRAGRLDSYLGSAALALAARIDSATAVMGFASLVKELRSTMQAATAGVAKAADPVDEVKARRDRKFAAG